MASRCDLLIFLEQKLSLVKDLCELSEPEKKKMLDLASGMDRIIIILLLESGLDLECLIKLRVSDLDIGSGQLRIAQNRVIQLSSGALKEINQFLTCRIAKDGAGSPHPSG
jgi:site-specific recombinase XerC